MDEETKEAVEEIVQKMIGKISDFVTRVHRAREVLMLKEESDFIFGWIWGEINAAISLYYALNFDRQATQDGMNELFEIISSHAQDMRNAIGGGD